MKERNKRTMIEDSMDDDLEESMDKAAKKGRGTDDTVGHLTKGEVIIPAQIMADPKNKQMIAELFKSSGGNLDEFKVSAEEISYTRKQLLEITIYELRELDDELGRITSLETHWRRTATPNKFHINRAG